ncbi:hypothetical protein, partial [Xanthomonas vesicatoria]|uniref:hypothetical protein n=1 Tax=Xanthomonas vesicatoria TaxID=56460 RepID=UPI001E51FE66
MLIFWYLSLHIFLAVIDSWLPFFQGPVRRDQGLITRESHERSENSCILGKGFKGRHGQCGLLKS